MQKSKILIVSGSRTKVLAEKLRDQLRTNETEAEFWEDAIRNRTTETAIEMMEWATETYDCAVILLDGSAESDSGGEDPLKTRDNLCFRTGFFLAALGRERCFVLNSEERPYLPPDLDGINPLIFREPASDQLQDRSACENAMVSVGSHILDRMQRDKKAVKKRPLSKETLLEREKLHPLGELEEGDVVVTVTEPMEIRYTGASQVRQNMRHGISYAYYFHGDPTRVRKICQLLQMLLLAPLLADEKEAEYESRMEKLRQPDIQERLIADLTDIGEHQLLKVYLIPTAPELQYVIHNATSGTDTILYFKHKDQFIEWERGEPAHNVCLEIRKRIVVSAVASNAIFCGAAGFDVKKGDFHKTLKCEMKRSFPGISEKIVHLCCDGRIKPFSRK